MEHRLWRTPLFCSIHSPHAFSTYCLRRAERFTGCWEDRGEEIRLCPQEARRQGGTCWDNSLNPEGTESGLRLWKHRRKWLIFNEDSGKFTQDVTLEQKLREEKVLQDIMGQGQDGKTHSVGYLVTSFLGLLELIISTLVA